MTARLQDLRVYQSARALIRLVAAICNKIPRGDRDLADQLKRSARSVQGNIAEGSASFGAEQRRYFGIARASAVESMAHVDAAEDLGYLDAALAAEARTLLDGITAMLTVMIFGKRGPSPKTGFREE